MQTHTPKIRPALMYTLVAVATCSVAAVTITIGGCPDTPQPDTPQPDPPQPMEKAVLGTDKFSLEFRDDVSLATMDYGGANLTLMEFSANIANTGSGDSWDFPESVTAENLGSGTKRVKFVYGDGKHSVVQIREHSRWLEFELVGVQGDCGEIRVFGPIFQVAKAKKYALASFCDLDNGLVAGLIPMTPETRTDNYFEYARSIQMLYTLTAPNIPTPKVVAHRFGFFVCERGDFAAIVREIEASAGYPPNGRANPENDADYIFLLSANGAASQQIIEMCRSLNIRSILLGISVWHDWCDTTEPYAVKPAGRRLISDLQAAGLYVGCHSFVHKVCATGYYATHPEHSQHVHPFTKNNRKNFKWDDDLPEISAIAYAQTIKQLGVSWVYLDGAELLWSDETKETNAHNWYLNARMTSAVAKELRASGVAIKVLQTSSAWSSGYHYITRAGQTDYWDDPAGYFDNPKYKSPTDSINIRARDFAELESRNVTPDLGWFGRVHVVTSPIGSPLTFADRYATLEEWKYLCEKSLEHDAPIGIRTTYDDWVNDPLRVQIENLVTNTIAKRASEK